MSIFVFMYQHSHKILLIYFLWRESPAFPGHRGQVAGGTDSLVRVQVQRHSVTGSGEQVGGRLGVSGSEALGSHCGGDLIPA